MANDFYQHSGHPGTRAPRSSALLRAEFAAVEDGFDKLPDVGTANLFSVSDGSALVGKTAAQAKVILALENVTNTADADKPISTLAQAALDLKADASTTTSALALKADVSTTTSALALKAPLASPALTGNPTAPTQAATDSSTKLATTAHVLNAFPYLTSPNGYQKFKGGIVVQWGSTECNATPGLGVIVTYPVAVTAVYAVVATGFLNDTTPATVWVANVTGTTFDLRAAVASQNAAWLAIGYITPA